MAALGFSLKLRIEILLMNTQRFHQDSIESYAALQRIAAAAKLDPNDETLMDSILTFTKQESEQAKQYMGPIESVWRFHNRPSQCFNIRVRSLQVQPAGRLTKAITLHFALDNSSVTSG